MNLALLMQDGVPRGGFAVPDWLAYFFVALVVGLMSAWAVRELRK